MYHYPACLAWKHLDSRELGTLVIPAGEQGHGLGAVLYDNVPGGAGHVRELLALGRPWLEEAREAMFVNQQHHETCETACLDCLLTFDAQEPMRKGLLQRRLAIGVLDALLSGNELPEAEQGSLNLPTIPEFLSAAPSIIESPVTKASSPTSEERLQRSQQRLAKRVNRRKQIESS